jgi:S-adenosylmethionine hydrolase
MNRIITLTTDFGLQDGYVGTMKGVISTLNPSATIVDITHQVAPQNIDQGAFLFATSARFFPANAIHVVVVDPGVGSTRRPIAIQVGETTFVAPDNGILSPAVEARRTFEPTSHTGVKAIHLTERSYWLSQVSHTFHGRDIFAPVAAHLSLGVPIEALGQPIKDWIRLSPARPERREDGTLVGRVRHIDGFGNVVINLAEEDFSFDLAQVTIRISKTTLQGIKRSYSQVATGEPVALIGSSGFLEVAIRDGNAARSLGVRVGDPVVVVP